MTVVLHTDGGGEGEGEDGPPQPHLEAAPVTKVQHHVSGRKRSTLEEKNKEVYMEVCSLLKYNRWLYCNFKLKCIQVF